MKYCLLLFVYTIHMSEMNGFLLIDKPEGYTSQDVDSIVKKRLGLKKVGHLGTLDPFATGLLVLALGNATRLMELIPDKKKEYVATLKLGLETDSLDKTGHVTIEKEVPVHNEESIVDVLNSFLGKSMQEVPKYSAKHINGKRAYSLVHQGIDFTPVTKEVEVYSIDLISYTDNTIVFKCSVSKGTYIRSLGRDIAYRLKTVGHLEQLRRTRVGNISIDDTHTLDSINEENVISIFKMFPDIPWCECNEDLIKPVLTGAKINVDFESEYIFMTIKSKLIALYRKDNGCYSSYRGFPRD